MHYSAEPSAGAGMPSGISWDSSSTEGVSGFWASCGAAASTTLRIKPIQVVDIGDGHWRTHPVADFLGHFVWVGGAQHHILVVRGQSVVTGAVDGAGFVPSYFVEPAPDAEQLAHSGYRRSE